MNALNKQRSLWELFWSRKLDAEPSVKESSDSVKHASAELIAQIKENARKAAADAHD